MVEWWMVELPISMRQSRADKIAQLLLLLAVLTLSRARATRCDDSARRDIVLFIVDDLRADMLGCYGDALARTPHIDALAERGTRFERAYAQATWCAPSRNSLFFGRYPVGNQLAPATRRERVSLGQHLKRAGYWSVRAGKAFHMAVPGDVIAADRAGEAAKRRKKASDDFMSTIDELRGRAYG